MYFEYKMSKEMANEILKARKGDNRKKNPQAYLCEYVNEQFGLRCEVTRIVYG